MHANVCTLADHDINACPLIQCLPVCLSSPCSLAFSCFTSSSLSFTLLNTIHLRTTSPGCGNRADTVSRLIDLVNKHAIQCWRQCSLQQPTFMWVWQTHSLPLFSCLLGAAACWFFYFKNLLLNGLFLDNSNTIFIGYLLIDWHAGEKTQRKVGMSVLCSIPNLLVSEIANVRCSFLAPFIVAAEM